MGTAAVCVSPSDVVVLFSCNMNFMDVFKKQTDKERVRESRVEER